MRKGEFAAGLIAGCTTRGRVSAGDCESWCSQCNKGHEFACFIGSYTWGTIDIGGFHYAGSMRNNKMEGSGIGTFANGDEYSGSWIDGKPDGSGVMKFKNGNIYVGEWHNGKRHGTG